MIGQRPETMYIGPIKQTGSRPPPSINTLWNQIFNLTGQSPEASDIGPNKRTWSRLTTISKCTVESDFQLKFDLAESRNYGHKAK